MAEKKSCFVIGPIGKAESEDRKRADTVLNYIISPTVEACGYDKPLRADQSTLPGMITIEIIEHLLNDDLVIADLTGANANVYYELAVRHARRKPFVQIIKKGEKNPFDTQDLRTIPVGTEINEAEIAKEALKGQIIEAENKGERIVTPISLVIDLELMRQSGDYRQKTLADLLGEMVTLHASIEEIKGILAIPHQPLPAYSYGFPGAGIGGLGSQYINPNLNLVWPGGISGLNETLTPSTKTPGLPETPEPPETPELPETPESPETSESPKA